MPSIVLNLYYFIVSLSKNSILAHFNRGDLEADGLNLILKKKKKTESKRVLIFKIFKIITVIVWGSMSSSTVASNIFTFSIPFDFCLQIRQL